MPVVPQPDDIRRDVDELSAELKRLEAEYNMYFAGRLSRPPWETRSRVEALIKRWDRRQIEAGAERFRFAALQSRFATFSDLWDRGLRAREEGRPGPFGRRPAGGKAPGGPDRPVERSRTLHAASFTDPVQEMDKLHVLYDRLMDARRRAGDRGEVPFGRFAGLVKEQVARLRAAGSAEVAFRVSEQDGKVRLVVRGRKSGGS